MTGGDGAMKKPAVGGSVHYQSYGTPGGEFESLPRAAIVTEVDPKGKRVGLCVLNPTGVYFVREVLQSLEPKAGYWNWPPRT
jgi:hypothetical protein